MENVNYNENQKKKHKNKNYNKQKIVQNLNEPKTEIDMSKKLEEINEALTEKQNEIINNISSIVDNQIEVSISKRLKEEEKRILRRKRGKIIRRDIFIIILLLIIGYLLYCLYSVDYHNVKSFINNKGVIEKEISNDIPKKDDKKLNQVEIEKYSYLIENLQILGKDEFYLYQKDYTKSTLSDDIKLQIAYNNLSEDKIKIENDTIHFTVQDLKETYKNIFGKNEEMNNKSFEYNDNRFLLYNEMYISALEDNILPQSHLVYLIDNAYIEDEERLVFEVIAGKYEDDKLINIVSGEEIKENFDKKELKNYKEKLTKYKFTFSKDNDNFYFDSIQKINNLNS